MRERKPLFCSERQTADEERRGQGMKITVEMNEEEFAEFMKFREAQKVELANLTALRKEFRAFAEAVYYSVDIDERKVIEPAALMQAVERAEKYRWI